MRRRNFLTALASAAAAWPHAVHAQQASNLPVIGFMSGRSPEDSRHLVEAFREGLRELDFIDGQNLAIEFRWARGQYDLLPALASELLKRNVTLLAAVGGDSSAHAAKKATTTVPIVFGMGGDPVATGLIESLGRPSGNATGYTLVTAEMEPKRLGLLHELLPNIPLIGALVNPDFPPAALQVQDLEAAARALGKRLYVSRASDDVELSLADAGMGPEDIVRLNVYSTDPEDLKYVRAHREKYLKPHHTPASTWVVVSRLANPKWVVEMETDCGKA